MIRDELFNSATVEGMVAAPGIKWHRDPPDVIPLWLADPDFPVAPAIKRALLNAVHDEDLFYNSDRAAREAMAAKIVRRNGLEADADDIMITQGVIPAMWLAIRYACRAGEEVVVSDPMYFPFFEAAETAEAKAVYWPLEMEEGYRFDIERLKELVTERTRLIFVCNPHNPCGRVMTEEELKGIADIAVDNGIAVMVDELWEDILFDGRRHITLASLSPDIADLTMTSWGFSKTYGVAGLQMGYLCATNKEMMDRLRRLSHRVFRGTSTLARAAAPVMLDGTLDWWVTDMMKHLHKIRALCERRFEETPGVTCPKLEGTYLMFPRFDYGMTSEELQKYMFEEARLSFSVGTQFGPRGEGHLRMCIATSETIINEAFDRMQGALEKLR
ncbi:MAG: aminotransferase class I/II-fold pyridoxal phosphate-dependent enzyme [Candidatus Bathyarchaeia archaeon]